MSWGSNCSGGCKPIIEGTFLLHEAAQYKGTTGYVLISIFNQNCEHVKKEKFIPETDTRVLWSTWCLGFSRDNVESIKYFWTGPEILFSIGVSNFWTTPKNHVWK